MSKKDRPRGVDRREFLQASAAATVGMAGMAQPGAAQAKDEPGATQTITSSMRLYYETRVSGWLEALDEHIDVPTACALFPVHPQLPRRWVENSYNVTRWTKMPSGGHFAAMEEPDLLVEDIRGFFRDLRHG